MRVVLERNVVDSLRALSPPTKRRMKAALVKAAASPNPPGADRTIKQVDVPGSGEPLFRLGISDHRAVFVVRGHEVRVLPVFHREEGYDGLRRLRLD